ncbi:MAG: hypothetical protein J6R67_10675 [Treponema sp.]|jgi:tetratricopeptide (TPR) repeat protein|nr:hypothetical protein [Treponema sp.]
MNTRLNNGLFQAYELLKEGKPAVAKPLLEDALADDLDNKEILFTIRCANFWKEEFLAVDRILLPFDKGERIIEGWKRFITGIINLEDENYEASIYAVRRGIFTRALENYQQHLEDPQQILRAEAYRKAAFCHKQLGSFEVALTYLKEANTLLDNVTKREDAAPILAEMADCYALCGQDNYAKVFFREAFFLGAGKIDLLFLDSELIFRLVELVRQQGYPHRVMKEWIPVYGVLYGVLNINRPLRPIEFSNLKRDITSLENEIQSSTSETAILVPRLINKYFWLIDYYMNINDDREMIEDTLRRIRLLNEDVYRTYTM